MNKPTPDDYRHSPTVGTVRELGLQIRRLAHAMLWVLAIQIVLLTTILVLGFLELVLE